MATAILNRETFCGRITDQTQALAWPRTGAEDGEGRCLDSDTIPAPIARATAELALTLLREDLTNEANHPPVFAAVRHRVGEADTEYARDPVHALPAAVRAFTLPLPRGRGSTSVLAPLNN